MRELLYLCQTNRQYLIMIEAIDIYKSYGNLKVLKGVNLKVEKGEIVSIVGASGAGKSTLLHIIGTIDKADSGMIKYSNTRISELNENNIAEFRNKNIGFVFQFHHLLPEFTSLENVCIPAFIANKNKKDAEGKAKKIMQHLGLSGRLDHKPSELSGGEQQRVAVARALINEPSVVLADEPSGNLDSEASGELHQLFFKLRNDLNQSFIIVTHNQKLADMADRKLTIKDGIIIN